MSLKRRVSVEGVVPPFRRRSLCGAGTDLLCVARSTNGEDIPVCHEHDDPIPMTLRTLSPKSLKSLPDRHDTFDLPLSMTGVATVLGPNPGLVPIEQTLKITKVPLHQTVIRLRPFRADLLGEELGRRSCSQKRRAEYDRIA